MTSRNDADDIAAQIARLREQVEALLGDRVGPAAAEAADAVREQADAVAAKVREQPLLAVLIAAVAGYVLGRTIR